MVVVNRNASPVWYSSKYRYLVCNFCFTNSINICILCLFLGVLKSLAPFCLFLASKQAANLHTLQCCRISNGWKGNPPCDTSYLIDEILKTQRSQHGTLHFNHPVYLLKIKFQHYANNKTSMWYIFTNFVEDSLPSRSKNSVEGGGNEKEKKFRSNFK